MGHSHLAHSLVLGPANEPLRFGFFLPVCSHSSFIASESEVCTAGGSEGCAGGGEAGRRWDRWDGVDRMGGGCSTAPFLSQIFPLQGRV